MEKRVALYTLGCKVNQGESQVMLDRFRQQGWRPVPFSGPAEVYVINTCTVTQAADQKSRKMIRSCKKQNPQGLLVVTGCYAEHEKAALLAMTAVDLVFGNGEKDGLPDLVEAAWQKRQKPEQTMAGAGGAAGAEGMTGDEAEAKAEAKAEAADGAEPAIQTKADDASCSGEIKGLDRTRGTIKLQDGCRQFCSYCIIPYVRRTWQSLPEADALAQAGALAAAGYGEIVLLGIHLGAYGWDVCPGDHLSQVLERLLTVYPAVRFRLGSLEPMEATADLLRLLRDYPNACKHLHLPLQSGTDRILQAMNRPYTTAMYRQKVCEVRRFIPDIALTTDIMVGFPGETEAEFAATAAFAEEMGFSRLHVFPYSRRPGTKAADFPEQISRQVKDERCRRLLAVGEKLQQRYGESWQGRRQWVLVEEEVADGLWSGHCDNYLEVTFTLPHLPVRPQAKGLLLPVHLSGAAGAKAGSWEAIVEDVQ